MRYQALYEYVVPSGSSPIVDLAASHGSWMVDITGKEYLDCHSQFASQALGWNYPTLLEDFADGQGMIVKLANPDFHSQIYVDFVVAFRKIVPDFNKFFFVEGGTLGVENALKAAFD